MLPGLGELFRNVASVLPAKTSKAVLRRAWASTTVDLSILFGTGWDILDILAAVFILAEVLTWPAGLADGQLLL